MLASFLPCELNMSDLLRTSVLLASAAGAAIYLGWKKRNLPYPPGPKGYPIIGNLLDIPTGFQWKTYIEWAKKYGEQQLTKYCMTDHQLISLSR